MATASELRQSIRQSRATLQQQQQQVQAQRLAEQSRRELQKRTKLGMVRRQQQKTAFEKAKQQKLQEVQQRKQAFEAKAQKVEAQIKAYEAAKAAQEKEASEWKYAEKIKNKPGAILYASKSVRQKISKLKGGDVWADPRTVSDVALAAAVSKLAKGKELGKFEAKIAEEKGLLRQETKGGIVSESLLKDIEAKAPHLLSKVEGYIPQAQMDVMAQYNRGEIGKGRIITTQEADAMKLSPEQRKLFKVIDTGTTASEWAAAQEKVKIMRDVLPFKKVSKWALAEARVKEKTTGKLPTAEQVFGTYNERQKVLADIQQQWEQQTGMKLKPFWKKAQLETMGTYKGAYEGIREKPLTTATTAGGVALLTGGLGLLGAGASSLGVSAGILSKAGTIGGITLGGLYGTSKYKEIKSTPSWMRSEKIGSILSTEILPMGVGGYLGAKYTPRLIGMWRTRGRTEIPIERLTQPEVISGKKSFPTAPPSQHYKLFTQKSQRLPGVKYGGSRYKAGKDVLVWPENLPVKQPGMMYHSAPEVWWTKTGLKVTQPGTSELPGLYGSSYISPHFLKTGGRYSGVGWDIFALGKKPGSAGIIPSAFKVNPAVKTKPYTIGDQIFKWKFRGKTQPGTAYIPKMKSEIEAVLPMGSEAGLIGTDYYFKWKDVRVPLDIYKMMPSITGAATSGTGGQTIGSLMGSYSLPSSSPIFNPASSVLFLGGGSSKTTPTFKPTSYYSTSKTTSYLVPPASSYSKISRPSSRAISSVSSSLISYSPGSSKISYSKPSSRRGITPSSSKALSRPRSSTYYSRPSSSTPSSYSKPSSYKRPTITSRQKPRRLMRTYAKRKTKQPAYIAEMRRAGKWYKVSNLTTIRRAVRKGKKAVIQTLGASYRVRKAGTDILVPLKTTKRFRPGSKGRDPFISVQRKYRIPGMTGRISSLGEKFEIKQKAKRRKRKSSKRKKTKK